MLHDALQRPKNKLRLALVHDYARDDKIHALAIAYFFVVKTVRSVDDHEHLLTLT